MDVTSTIFLVIEIIGTIAFAVTGAMIAIRHDLDVFGVLFMGVVVALGGGTLRDIILGINPPRMFSNFVFVLVAAGAALVVFVLAWMGRKFYDRHVKQLDGINNIFDALGLAAFTVTGVEAAIAAGHGGNIFLCVMMGMTTAVGGGIIRDICVHEVPMVFSKNIYALASIAGGLFYCALYYSHAPVIACSFVTLAVTFGIRLLAIIFHLNLPHAGVTVDN
ncbi:MAG: trimeric intracellular cation channel family protein [Clostridia bacterium]|nr:trimeric intracellular cation channel family protein [Clostridia bacterium]